MHEAPLPKLRIAYVVPSERYTVFLPPHKSIPDESCIYRALETGVVETAEEDMGRERVAALPSGGNVNAARRRCRSIASRCGTSHHLSSPRRYRTTAGAVAVTPPPSPVAIRFLGEVCVNERG
jgi:hypothetical protein